MPRSSDRPARPASSLCIALRAEHARSLDNPRAKFAGARAQVGVEYRSVEMPAHAKRMEKEVGREEFGRNPTRCDFHTRRGDEDLPADELRKSGRRCHSRPAAGFRPASSFPSHRGSAERPPDARQVRRHRAAARPRARNEHIRRSRRKHQPCGTQSEAG